MSTVEEYYEKDSNVWRRTFYKEMAVGRSAFPRYIHYGYVLNRSVKRLRKLIMIVLLLTFV